MDNEYLINDPRLLTDFKNNTFSNFKKSAVKNELLKSLNNCKIEQSWYWSAQLICSGYVADLWEIILLFTGKYIHLANPKLPLYINKRADSFRDILFNKYNNDALRLRNDMKIRKIFAEIILILCESTKKNCLTHVIIDKKDINSIQMSNKLKAPNVNYSENIFHNTDDPKELFIPINELAYHLSSESKNIWYSCYWIEWIIEFENICKKHKKKLICKERTFAPVKTKFHRDTIWLIWDVIIHKTNSNIKNIIHSIINIFSIKYKKNYKNKRYLLYFAVLLLIENVDTNIKINNNMESISEKINKINIIYKEIKKDECEIDLTDNKNISSADKIFMANIYNFIPTLK